MPTVKSKTKTLESDDVLQLRSSANSLPRIQRSSGPRLDPKGLGHTDVECARLAGAVNGGTRPGTKEDQEGARYLPRDSHGCSGLRAGLHGGTRPGKPHERCKLNGALSSVNKNGNHDQKNTHFGLPGWQCGLVRSPHQTNHHTPEPLSPIISNAVQG